MNIFNNLKNKIKTSPRAGEGRRVTFSNKVMDTRDWHSLWGVPPKYDVSGWYRGRLLNAFCMFFKYPSPDASASTSPAGGEVLKQVLRPQCAPDATGFSSDVYKRGTRARKFLADGVQGGRSMIEMLGVLAIIAMLSVSGIAGYSKAMEKFKVNKLIQEYNDLIFGLLEYRQSFQENIKGEPHLTNSIMALNLVPSTWIKLNDMYLQDSLGNWVNIRYRQTNNSYSDIEKGGVIIDFNLGGLNIDSSGNRSSDNFNEKICFEMLNNIVQPLHQTLYGLMMVGGSGRYFGDTYCQNNQSCLKNMTLAQMQQVCKSCNRSNRCNVTIIF